MKKHNIAILGLAHWYWAYPIAGIASVMPNATLSWIMGENEEQTKKTAQLMKAQRWTLDYKEVLEDPEVDIVVITSTTDRYEEMAVAAAEHGKHILISKPVARTLTGADHIMHAVKENNVKLVGYGAGPNPTDPLIKLLESGVIGKPYAAFSSCRARMPLQAPGDTNPGWYCDADHAAGGAFIDHAIYAATRMRAAFKSPVKKVYAQMKKMAHPEFNVEDYGIAIIEYESGATVTIESTFGATEYTQNNVIVTGTEGEISIDDEELRITGSQEAYKVPKITKLQGKNSVYLTVDDYFNPFGAQMGVAEMASAILQELIDVIDNGLESLNTIESARDGLEICLAAYKSVETGAPVELPLKEDVDVKSILAKVGVFNG